MLDCFCGSGTTLEAAHRLGRHWLGVDNSPEAIRTTLARFAKGVEPMGDFVRRMEREDTDLNDEGILPLFDLEKSNRETPPSGEEHNPIRGFTLHVSASFKSADVLKDWLAIDSANLVAEEASVLREELSSVPVQPVRPRRDVRYSAKKAKGSGGPFASQARDKSRKRKAAAPSGKSH